VYAAHGGGIVRFPAGSGSASTIVSGESPHALTLLGSALYWTNEAYQLRHANTDGSGLSTLTTMTSAIGDVASDGINVYFTWSSNLLALPVGSSGPPLLLAGGLSGLSHIATDGSDVYWSDASSVSKIPVNGGAKTMLHSTNGDVTDLVVDGTAVFWTSSTAVMKLFPK
jgi:hypothetical protein